MFKSKLALAVALGLGMSSPLWAADGGIEARLAALGTQVVELPEGRFAGHTFHYSKSDTPLQPLVNARTAHGREGEAVYRLDRLTASYVHFYFPSNPAAVASLFGS